MVQRFDEICKNRHDYARKLKKRTGGKIIGFFRTYASEGIMVVSNSLPVRTLGRATRLKVLPSLHLLSSRCTSSPSLARSLNPEKRKEF